MIEQSHLDQARAQALLLSPRMVCEGLGKGESLTDREVALCVAIVEGHSKSLGCGGSAESYRRDALARRILASPDECSTHDRADLRACLAGYLQAMQRVARRHRDANLYDVCRSAGIPWENGEPAQG